MRYKHRNRSNYGESFQIRIETEVSMVKKFTNKNRNRSKYLVKAYKYSGLESSAWIFLFLQSLEYRDRSKYVYSLQIFRGRMEVNMIKVYKYLEEVKWRIFFTSLRDSIRDDHN